MDQPGSTWLLIRDGYPQATTCQNHTAQHVQQLEQRNSVEWVHISYAVKLDSFSHLVYKQNRTFCWIKSHQRKTSGNHQFAITSQTTKCLLMNYVNVNFFLLTLSSVIPIFNILTLWIVDYSPKLSVQNCRLKESVPKGLKRLWESPSVLCSFTVGHS